MGNREQKKLNEEQKSKDLGSGLSRRDFLKGAAVGVAGVAAAGALSACENPTEYRDVYPDMTADTPNQTWAFERPPAKITNFSDTVEADIVVIGSGMAGLTTTLSALQTAASESRNLKVVLISGSVGPISRGGSNSSVYSKIMQRAGIVRRDEAFWQEYFSREQLAASYRIDQRKWSKFFNQSERCMDWLIDIAESNQVVVSLERDNLDKTGEIMVAHNFNGAAGSGAGAGQQSIVNVLADLIQGYSGARTGQIDYLTVARQLIRGDDNKTGRVTGVVAEKINEDGTGTGTYIRYNGSKAVVLATGDFSGDIDMVAKYCSWVLPLISAPLFPDPPNLYDKSFALGSGLYKGDGQKMGLWVGAAWQHIQPTAPMLQGSLPGQYSASYQAMGQHPGLVVNTRGERFYNEDLSSPYAATLVANQPGRLSVSIWTDNFYDVITSVQGRDFRSFGEQYYPTPPPHLSKEERLALWNSVPEPGAYGGALNADNLTDLSEKLVAAFAGPQFGNNGGISPETGGLTAPQLRAKLLATIQRYNALVDSGTDTDFLKDPSLLGRVNIDNNGDVVGTGKIHYEINYCQYMTIVGGLRTDEHMQICDESDAPIPGLFNIGVMVGDVYSNIYNFAIPGHSYGGNCLTFGKILGEELVRDQIPGNA
jgi:succinate dehydrogenase/fumarate reductase flavoprotein subunit